MSMSDPQEWAIIGVFASAMLGGLGLVVTMMSRVIRAEIGSLGTTLTGRIDSLDTRLGSRIDGLDARLGGEIGSMRVELRSGFATLTTRVDGLDRDVREITDRPIRDDR